MKMQAWLLIMNKLELKDAKNGYLA